MTTRWCCDADRRVSERGYHAAVDIHRVDVPQRVDIATGAITCSVKKVYRIRTSRLEIRRG